MKSEKVFRFIMIFLFVIFLTIYISYGSGYYEYELHKKVELTNEQILKFENDIKNNVDIDLNEYLNNKHNDYSNSFSKISNEFSNFTSKYIKKGISSIIDGVTNLLSCVKNF